MRHSGAHKVALMAMLLALAIALGVADYYIPFPFVPGAKLGLANIVILVVLYELGIWEAGVIDLGRVFIVSLLTGRIFQMGFFMESPLKTVVKESLELVTVIALVVVLSITRVPEKPLARAKAAEVIGSTVSPVEPVVTKAMPWG